MATASLTTNYSGKELALTACEVRVWGMDTQEKPFIQTVTARHITEKGALLTGLLPVKIGDTVGVKYRDLKGRFKVTWVSDQDAAQTRSVGIDCIENKNIWGMRVPIPIQNTSAMYSEANTAEGNLNRRKAERYSCRVAAAVTLDNAVAQAYAWVSDISRKGCYLEMISPFAVGAGIVASIYAVDLRKESALVLRGVVRTCHPMVGMGVEFVDVSAEDVKSIQVVLERLSGAKAISLSVQHQPVELTAPPVPSVTSTATASFTVRHRETFPANSRTLATRIITDMQNLESETTLCSRDPKLMEEVRKAAVHMRNFVHLCPAEQR